MAEIGSNQINKENFMDRKREAHLLFCVIASWVMTGKARGGTLRIHTVASKNRHQLQ